MKSKELDRNVLDFIANSNKEYSDIVKIMDLVEQVYPCYDAPTFVGEFMESIGDRLDSIIEEANKAYKDKTLVR